MYSPEEILKRAYSRIDETKYSVLKIMVSSLLCGIKPVILRLHR